MKKNNLNFYLSIFNSVIIFSITYYLSLYYVNGDQKNYIRVYDEINNFSFFEAYVYYRASLGSSELSHFLLVWLVSEYISKELLMSFLNSVMAFYSSRIMLHLSRNNFIVLAILTISYYPMVLYLSAERLKIGLLLFFIFFWYQMVGRYKLSYFYACISVLTHVQLSIMYASLLSKKFLQGVKSIFLESRVTYFSLFLFVFISVVITFFSGYLYSKFLHYAQGADPSDLLKFVFVYLMTLYYGYLVSKGSKQQLRFITVLFLPLLFATLIMGSSRIIFFGYFIFLYYALRVNKGLNVGVGISLIYGVYKTFYFVFGVLERGDGFET